MVVLRAGDICYSRATEQARLLFVYEGKDTQHTESRAENEVLERARLTDTRVSQPVFPASFFFFFFFFFFWTARRPLEVEPRGPRERTARQAGPDQDHRYQQHRQYPESEIVLSRWYSLFPWIKYIKHLLADAVRGAASSKGCWAAFISRPVHKNLLPAKSTVEPCDSEEA